MSLRAFAAATGADSIDNGYYRFDVPPLREDEAEVERLVLAAQAEMERLEKTLPPESSK